MNTKKLLVTSVTVNVMLLLMMGMGFVWADSNGVWTNAEDVRSGTFGSDEGGGNFTFPDSMTVDGEVCLNGECHGSWENMCQSWVDQNAIN